MRTDPSVPPYSGGLGGGVLPQDVRGAQGSEGAYQRPKCVLYSYVFSSLITQVRRRLDFVIKHNETKINLMIIGSFQSSSSRAFEINKSEVYEKYFTFQLRCWRLISGGQSSHSQRDVCVPSSGSVWSRLDSVLAATWHSFLLLQVALSPVNSSAYLRLFHSLRPGIG